MRCRFCGQDFDSERGLHVHQGEMHGEVEKDLREILDHDAEKVVALADKSDYNLAEVIRAEKEICGRDDVVERLAGNIEHVDEDVDVEEELSLLDKIKDKVRSVTSTKRQKEKIRDDTGRLDDEVESLQDEIASLEEKKASLKEEIRDYHDEKNSYEDRLDSLRGQIRRLQSEEARLDDHLEEYQRKKQKLTTKLERVNEKLSSVNPGDG